MCTICNNFFQPKFQNYLKKLFRERLNDSTIFYVDYNLVINVICIYEFVESLGHRRYVTKNSLFSGFRLDFHGHVTDVIRQYQK